MDAGEFASVFSQMAIFFAMMGIGALAHKLGFMGTDVDRHISKLVLNVTLPAMILASVLDASSLPSRSDLLMCLLLSSVACLTLVALAFAFTAVTRTPAGVRGVYRFMVTFGNVGFLGFPIVSAIFGTGALIFASVCNLPFNLLVFTVGRWFVASDGEGSERAGERGAAAFKKRVRSALGNMRSPALAACLAAILFALAGVCSVPVLGQGLTTLGEFTTPAAMLIVGSSLAGIPAKAAFTNPRLFAMAAFRLVVSPVVLFALLAPFTSNAILLGVILTTSAMPVATNGTLFCYECGGDTRLMSQGTFLTTVLSLVTVPLLVVLLT